MQAVTVKLALVASFAPRSFPAKSRSWYVPGGVSDGNWTPIVPELPPLALFGSGLLLLSGLAYRARRRQ